VDEYCYESLPLHLLVVGGFIHVSICSSLESLLELTFKVPNNDPL
jgi:hypothetical protein